MALPPIFVVVGAKIEQFEKAMGDVSKRLNGIDRDAQKAFSGFDKVGERLSGVGVGLTAALTVPLAGIGVASLKAAGDFESSMKKIEAFGEITGDALGKLKNEAIRLGKDTKFSAQEAADGMAVLASAGFNAGQIFDATAGILDLAAAGELGVADAARLAQDTLSQFGLEASKTGHIADVLAQAAVDAKASLGDMGLTLTYVGPQAKNLGISIEDTTAAIIALDKAGIRGEKAGTGLRGVLAALANTAGPAGKRIKELGIDVKDLEGNFLGLPSITAQFQTALAKMNGNVERAAVLTKIFGTEAANAASKLIENGGPALDEYGKKLQNVDGKAREVSKTLNSGLEGAMEELRGSIETAAIAFGEILLPSATKASKGVQAFVNESILPLIGKLKELPSVVKTGLAGLVGFAALIGPSIVAIGQFVIGLSGIATAVSSLSQVLVKFAVAPFIDAMGRATLAVASFGRAAVVGFAELGASSVRGVGLLTSALSGIPSMLGRIPSASVNAFSGLIGSIGSVVNIIRTQLLVSFGQVVSGMANVGASIASAGFSGFITSIQAVTTAIKAQLVVSLASLTAALANISFAIQAGLIGALTTAELALLAIGGAVVAAAAAFAAWKIGEWAYSQIPGVKALGDRIGDLIMKIPGATAVMNYLSGATAATASATDILSTSVPKLEAALAKKGITVDKTGKSLQEYGRAVLEAAKANGLLGSSSDNFAAKVEEAKKQIIAAEQSAKAHAEAQRQLGIKTAAAAAAQAGLGKGVKDTGAKHDEARGKVTAFLDKFPILAEKVAIVTQEYRKNIHDLAQMQLAQERGKKVIGEFAEGLDELNKALEEIGNTTRKTPSIPESLIGDSDTGIASIKAAVAALDADLSTLGINHDKTADKVVAAYERIKNAGILGPREILQAERAALEARIREHQAAGEKISAVDLARLETLKKATGDAGTEQVKATKRWAQQVSTIVNDLARDIAKSTVNFFKGLFDFDGFNKKLREDSDKLREELAARTDALDEFRQSTEAKIAASGAGYAQQLERETGELRSALAERLEEFAEFQAEVAGKLDALRGAEAARLSEELADLAAKLRDKEEAYEEYVNEVAGREEELRTSHAERLAEQLADLQSNLADKAEAYADYAAEANRNLARIGEDLNESIDDDTRSANRKIEDENRDFARDSEKLTADLRKAEKRGDKEATANLRKQLQQRTEDHERALKRIKEDLDEQVSDAKRQAERQTADLRENLAIRTREHQQYVAENIAKQAEVAEDNRRSLDRQLADLQESLDKRTAALLAFRAQTELDIAAATAASGARLEREERELEESLKKRQDKLEEFRRETELKVNALTEHYRQKQEEEIASLNAAFADKLKEYDTYRTGVEAKLEELEAAHKGPLDRLRDMFTSVFDSASEAILRVASEEVIGSLIGKIGKLVTDTFPSLSKAIAGVFTSAASVAGGASTSAGTATIEAITGGAGAPAGGAGAAAGGLSGAAGAVDLITGAISAAASVVSAIYNVRIEGTLNKIEVNTAAASIHLENTLKKANEFWPYMRELHLSVLGLVVPTLREIRDGLKTLFSVNLNLSDDDQKKLVSSLITRVGTFDTLATDRLLDIHARLGDVVFAIQDMRKNIFEVITSTSANLRGGLAAIENKLPSTLTSILGAVTGGLSGIAGIVPSAIGGLIAGLVGRGSGKTDDLIEENTRYAAGALIGPKGVIALQHEAFIPLNSIDQFMIQKMGPSLNTIIAWTEDNAAKMDDVYELISTKTNRYLEQLALGGVPAAAGGGHSFTFNVPIYLDARLIGNAIVERNELGGGGI